MKNFNTLLLVFVMLGLGSLYAQTSGGPDLYGYIWKTQANTDPDAPTYNWIDITTTGTIVTGLGDDNSVGPLNIGFDFPYYWFTYNLLYVGSNGYVSFDNINISSTGIGFPPTPTADATNNFMAPQMCDLTLASALPPATPNPGNVYLYTNNLDTCIISYELVPFWISNTNGWGGANTFQVILSKVDSSITFQYKTQTGTYDPAYATSLNPVVVGMENVTGNIGLLVSNNTLPTINRAVKFYYPHPVTFQVTDAAPTWVKNEESGGFFVPINGSAVTGSALIENKGNVIITTPTGVQLSITNAAGAQVHTDAATVTSLGLGGNALVNFNAGYTPTVAGSYTYQVTTTNSADINPGNNVNPVEMKAVDTTQMHLDLSYWNGISTALVGNLNWNGGGSDDGAGIYMEPPLYTVEVTDISVFITGLGLQTGTNSFEVRMYDDDASAGLGTLLASEFVSTTNVVNNAWNTITLTTPIRVDSGGFYVSWYMTGGAIGLGTEATAPFSIRGYEVLNDIWAPYRSRTSQEFLIRVGMDKVCTTILNVDIGADTTICSNETLVLDGGAGHAGYLWSTGASTRTISVNSAGTYIVSVDSAFCLGFDTINVSINNAPTTNLGPDIAFCVGGSAMLDAGSGFAGYSWSTGASSQTITVSTSGVYTATVTDANGCMDTDDVIVVVNPLPNIDLGPDLNRCAGDMVPLDAGLGFTAYNWSTGAGTSNITVTVAGKYWVDVIDANGCQNSDTIVVNFDGANVNLGADTSFCEGTTYNLDAGAGFAAYVWSNGTTTQTLGVTQAGTYFVTVIDGNCTGSDTVTLTIDPLPVAGFTFVSPANPLQYAFNNSSQFGLSYLWDLGDGNTSTMTSVIHTYAIGGNYMVCLTATNACGPDSTCQLLRGVSIDPDFLKEEIQVMPVPAKDEVLVRMKDVDLDNASLHLVNLHGQTLYTQELGDIHTSVTLRVDCSEIAAGIYYLMIKSDKYAVPRKIIISR